MTQFTTITYTETGRFADMTVSMHDCYIIHEAATRANIDHASLIRSFRASADTMNERTYRHGIAAPAPINVTKSQAEEICDALEARATDSERAVKAREVAKRYFPAVLSRAHQMRNLAQMIRVVADIA